MDRFRFLVKFLAVIAAINVLFSISFFLSILADSRLKPLLSDLPNNPMAAYFLAIPIFGPLFVMGGSAWYHFRGPRVPNSRYISIRWATILLTALFAGNLLVIYLRRDFYQHWDSVVGRIMSHQVAAAHSPQVIIPLLVLFLWGLHWVFKRHESPPPEVDRVIVYAMSMGGVVAFLLQVFGRLIGSSVIPPLP